MVICWVRTSAPQGACTSPCPPSRAGLGSRGVSEADAGRPPRGVAPVTALQAVLRDALRLTRGAVHLLRLALRSTVDPPGERAERLLDASARSLGGTTHLVARAAPHGRLLPTLPPPADGYPGRAEANKPLAGGRTAPEGR